MNINFGLEMIVIVIIVLLALGYFLNKKFHILNEWMITIKKFPLFFLLFFPPIFTYLFVCGAFSALAVGVYTSIKGENGFDNNEFLLMENCIEFLCSFGMTFLYFLILKKQDFPKFWFIVITIIHMVAAGYRDAKLISYSDGKESGPIILKNFEYVDAFFPLLSLLFFMFIFRKSFKFKLSTQKSISM
jgi:hypothetical protein